MLFLIIRIQKQIEQILNDLLFVLKNQFRINLQSFEHFLLFNKLLKRNSQRNSQKMMSNGLTLKQSLQLSQIHPDNIKVILLSLNQKPDQIDLEHHLKIIRQTLT